MAARIARKSVIIAAAMAAAIMLFIGGALIPSKTAAAYVYTDNTSGYIIPIGTNTIVEDIPIYASAGNGRALCLSGRSSVGYASEILNTTYYFSLDSMKTATHFYALYIIGYLNSIVFQLSEIYYSGGVGGIVYSHQFDITPSTTAIRYSVFFLTNTNGATLSIIINNQIVYTPQYLSSVQLDNASYGHKYYLGYAFDTGAINTSIYDGNSHSDWGIGYVNNISNSSIREIAAAGTYATGYQAGLDAGIAQAEDVNAWTMVGNIWSAMDGIMSIEILPNFKLWYIIGIPLASALIAWIVKMFRG